MTSFRAIATPLTAGAAAGAIASTSFLPHGMSDPMLSAVCTAGLLAWAARTAFMQPRRSFASHVPHSPPASTRPIDRVALEKQVIDPFPDGLEAYLVGLLRPGPTRFVGERLTEAARSAKAGETPWRSPTLEADPGRGHAYPTGRVLAAYADLLKVMGDAESHLAWIADVDARLWHAISSVTRPKALAQGAGAVCHWKAETAAGRPLAEPVVPSLDDSGSEDRAPFMSDTTSDRLDPLSGFWDRDETDLEPAAPVDAQERRPTPAGLASRVMSASSRWQHVVDVAIGATAALVALPLAPLALASAGWAAASTKRPRPCVDAAWHPQGRSRLILGDPEDRAAIELESFVASVRDGAGGFFASATVEPEEFAAHLAEIGRLDDLVVVSAVEFTETRDTLDLFSTIAPGMLAERIVASRYHVWGSHPKSVRQLLAYALSQVGGNRDELEDRIFREIDLERILEVQADIQDRSSSARASLYLESIPGFQMERGMRQAADTLGHHDHSASRISMMFGAHMFPDFALAETRPTADLLDIVASQRILFVKDSGEGETSGLLARLVCDLLSSQRHHERRRFVLSLFCDQATNSLPPAHVLRALDPARHVFQIGMTNPAVLESYDPHGRLVVDQCILADPRWLLPRIGDFDLRTGHGPVALTPEEDEDRIVVVSGTGSVSHPRPERRHVDQDDDILAARTILLEPST